MKVVKLADIITDFDIASSFKMFRDIEEWLVNHIPGDRWRFDYSSTICVCGVDIPGRIFFWSDADVDIFLANQLDSVD